MHLPSTSWWLSRILHPKLQTSVSSAPPRAAQRQLLPLNGTRCSRSRCRCRSRSMTHAYCFDAGTTHELHALQSAVEQVTRALTRRLDCSSFRGRARKASRRGADASAVHRLTDSGVRRVQRPPSSAPESTAPPPRISIRTR